MKWYQWLGVGAGVLVVSGLFNRSRVMNDLKKIRFSANFTADEFVTTSTGIENIPGAKELENLKALTINVLQPARDYLAKKYAGKKIAWIINSGYRSPAVNKVIGGAKTSQHLTGEASDNKVLVDGVQIPNQEIIEAVRALNLPYDQIIDEQLRGSKWVHISYSKKSNRKQWMTARDGANGTVYATVKVG
jgi:hypothetical protein